jgi:hypothetical protein
MRHASMLYKGRYSPKKRKKSSRATCMTDSQSRLHVTVDKAERRSISGRWLKRVVTIPR